MTETKGYEDKERKTNESTSKWRESECVGSRSLPRAFNRLADAFCKGNLAETALQSATRAAGVGST